MQGTALFCALNEQSSANRQGKQIGQPKGIYRQHSGNRYCERIETGAQLIKEAPRNIRLLYTLAIQHHWSDYYQDGTARRVASDS